MKNRNRKSILAAALAAILIAVVAIPALAALPSKEITVYPGVNIYVDDAKLNPTDANGNPVEVFIYNGTTYLPVRAVSQALDKAIQWDGSTSSVYIGKHGGAQPSVWLSDLDYFYTNFRALRSYDYKDNLGNEHSHSFLFNSDNLNDRELVYKLNGQYSKFTGTFYQLFDYRSNGGNATLTIYADDKQIWTEKVGPGVDPADININLTGALELKLKFHSDALYPMGECYAALGDAGLWT